MKKKKKRIIIVFAFLLLLLGGMTGYFLLKSPHKLSVYDSNAKDYQSKIKKPEDWPKSKIAFPAYGNVKVLEGTDKLYIALQNPSFNEANLKYIIYLDEKIETKKICETDLIQPGKAITEVDLPKELSKGEHTIYLHTKAFAPNDPDTKLNSFETSFKLTVLEN
ncbi:DUF4832 domain-containing protein [Enterococcus avium]|uniref:DUF4832 domain-containing protein n=1 Tax=Enterococcus avium TaxID=33945 RepID=UPI001F593257|nr:DUF4832 domain-containing protein [Enterococcus avium]